MVCIESQDVCVCVCMRKRERGIERPFIKSECEWKK